MITKLQYVEYLLSTPKNYTCTNLAAHLDGVSHAVITDYLRRDRLTARTRWDAVRGRIVDGPVAFLIVDDSVPDKRYARAIELVTRPYSGATHGLVRGIGVVKLVHSSGLEGECSPIDYRVYGPEADGKTKHDHFREMRVKAVADTQIKARTVLFDTWYASVANLTLGHGLGLVFFTTVKETRLVSLSKAGDDVHLDALEWTAERLTAGLLVKLKAVPCTVRLFKVVATNGALDWVITTRPDETVTARVAQDANDVRWQVEELHRGVKPLTGSEQCPCRKARSQRKHLACCYHAWLSLKVTGAELGQTLYQVRADLLRD